MRGLFPAILLALGAAPIACGSDSSGGGPADDGYVPTIDGQWSRPNSEERIGLVGPGLYASSGSVTVILTNAEGDSDEAQGQLVGRKISFTLTKPHVINLLNDSQIDLDGSAPPYEKPFTPDLTSGVWCEIGSPGARFEFLLSGVTVGNGCSEFLGTRTDESGVTDVAGVLCPSDPTAGEYAATIGQFTLSAGASGTWNGEFVGESRIELSFGSSQLTLQRRASVDGCD